MEILKANKFILKLSGLLTNIHRSKIYKCYGFLIQLGVVIFIIPHSLNIFTGNIHDLTVLSIQIAYNLESILTFIKIILFVSYKENIFEILEKLQKNVNKSIKIINNLVKIANFK